AVDGVSWRILLEDLETAYHQLGRGEKIDLPGKTTSYQQWAESLREYSKSSQVETELSHWKEQSRSGVRHVPVDFPVGVNTASARQRVEVTLSEGETRELQNEVPRTYQTQMNDVLLTALGGTLCNWSGGNAVLVDVEGHGREEIIGGVDLTRTVGWFTSIYPVRLEVVKGEGLGESLRRVKEQMRRIPNRGVGYGVLKYLSEERVRRELEGREESEVSFNYLGQYHRLAAGSGWGISGERTGSNHSGTANRRHLIEIDGFTVGGELRLTWSYSARKHRRETIEGLARDYLERLRELMRHCRSNPIGAYTPSDFPKAKLSQEELDELLAELH
ncbi:MAG: condensation domain-containing protein, partial [Blastocatellia bacterium]